MLGEYYETGSDPLSILQTLVEQHIAGTNGHETDHDAWYYPRTEIDAGVNLPLGFVKLDAEGRLPASMVAGNLDEVVAYNTLALFPAIGEDGVLYLTRDTNYGYRWTGVSYALVTNPTKLGEAFDDAYRGDRGKLAYDHSVISHGNPHGVTKAEVGLGAVDNTADIAKPVSDAVQDELDKLEPAIIVKNTAFNKNFGVVSGTVAQGNHNHDNVYLKTMDAQADYEPIITAKNTAFNKNFGDGTNDVARGNHRHTPTELGLNAYQLLSTKGQPNGYVPLRADGTIDVSFLPAGIGAGGGGADVNGIKVDTSERAAQTVLLYTGAEFEYRPFPDFSNITPAYGAVFAIVEV